MLLSKWIPTDNSFSIFIFSASSSFRRIFVGQTHVIDQGCSVVWTAVQSVHTFSTGHCHFDQLFREFDAGFSIKFDYVFVFSSIVEYKRIENGVRYID